MTSPGTIPPPVVAITATGFASTIAQIVVIRELLVLFHGNETSTGVIFACWLLWSALGSGTAGRLSTRFPPGKAALTVLLTLLALMLPVSVYLIRAARRIFSIPLGELPTIGKMVTIAFGVTGGLCLISGALFGVCWAFASRGKAADPGNPPPLTVYLGEALGAAAGGLAFYFLLFPFFSTLSLSIIVSVLILMISGWVARVWRLSSGSRILKITWFLATFILLLSALFRSEIETQSRRLQWGSSVNVVHDTPYHNIAIIHGKQNVSVFTNGLWMFSTPDKLSAERAVHPALLQHRHPRAVLLIGSGIAGHIEEVLKYPNVERIDYVEPDPDLIGFAEKHLPLAQAAYLRHHRLQMLHEDAATFIRRQKSQYDAILMNVGDPINAEMNRFYTVEFFEQIDKRLLPGGIFSFAVSGGEEMMGHVQARFISAIQNTLHRIFPEILIIPGDQMRFIATNSSGELTTDVPLLVGRISERSLDLSYIREDTLRDMLNPFRLDYLKSLLTEFRDASTNTDFSPICYFHTLMLWAFQWHPRIEPLFSTLASIDPFWFWSSLVIFGLLLQTFFWTGPNRFQTAVAGSIVVSGAMEMVLQIVLLLTFQVLEGFVYLQLALIIAFFMAGIGLGTGCVSRWKHVRDLKQEPRALAGSYFIRIQALFTLFPIGLIILLGLVHGELRDSISSPAMGWIFSGLSLTAGFIGGMHFGMAVLTFDETDRASDKIGGILYGLDLTGAAGGVLIASLFIIPVYGLINTLIFLSILSLFSLLTLLRRPR